MPSSLSHASACSVLAALLASDDSCDVSVRCADGVVVRGHRALLSAGCAVLRAQLAEVGASAGVGAPAWLTSSASGIGFTAVKRWLYGSAGEAIAADDALAVRAAAHAYGLRGLEAAAVRALSPLLASGPSAATLLAALLAPTGDDVGSHAALLLNHDLVTQAIVAISLDATRAVRSADFAALPADTAALLLGCDDLALDAEEDAAEAALLWGAANAAAGADAADPAGAGSPSSQAAGRTAGGGEAASAYEVPLTNESNADAGATAAAEAATAATATATAAWRASATTPPLDGGSFRAQPQVPPPPPLPLPPPPPPLPAAPVAAASGELEQRAVSPAAASSSTPELSSSALDAAAPVAAAEGMSALRTAMQPLLACVRWTFISTETISTLEDVALSRALVAAVSFARASEDAVVEDVAGVELDARATGGRVGGSVGGGDDNGSGNDGDGETALSGAAGAALRRWPQPRTGNGAGGDAAADGDGYDAAAGAGAALAFATSLPPRTDEAAAGTGVFQPSRARREPPRRARTHPPRVLLTTNATLRGDGDGDGDDGGGG